MLPVHVAKAAVAYSESLKLCSRVVTQQCHHASCSYLQQFDRLAGIVNAKFSCSACQLLLLYLDVQPKAMHAEHTMFVIGSGNLPST
jgi:hypothetical protein